MKCTRQDVLIPGPRSPRSLKELFRRVIKMPIHPEPGTLRTLKIALEGGPGKAKKCFEGQGQEAVKVLAKETGGGQGTA